MNQVVRAEEMGFTHFWTVEHHFQVGFAHCSAPEVLYGAISQRTSKIRIGHAVVLLPFPYNHPIRIAERVATLDILSNGRVEVGTGRSITQVELGGFGIPYKETRARWEEALDIITTIWKSKDVTFSYKGRYFDIPERTVVPMPSKATPAAVGRVHQRGYACTRWQARIGPALVHPAGHARASGTAGPRLPRSDQNGEALRRICQ
jgi:alkanesulfonate monooxygenase SsuD/methylene tetrahydromethanopterin reductase-like flavin-dependent oxidoreductase (luciferase family)